MTQIWEVVFAKDRCSIAEDIIASTFKNTNNNMNVQRHAERILRSAYGQDASFREGQLEAIKATLTNKRTLVVQKTGWGKSIIYFIATKIIRETNGGTTIIISPLLELMNNQIETASLFQLRCQFLNSTVQEKSDRQRILHDLKAGHIDVFFTTPETLFKDDLQAYLPDVNIGLFVIDEAHCLSDWGHDFRREYSRLYRIINMLPSSTPVLCTTATANNRVIDDLTKHLGEDIIISRGDLMRPSLCLQIIRLQNKAERYAWILDHIHDLPGTGIIYCLTKRDCDHLSNFLKQNGIHVEAYYSDNKREAAGLNQDAIDGFKANKIKAIVATIKLGMGYDKPDIGFVIHFQRPQNVVAYYQQIGRAGRSLDRAYAILMTGPEDDDILNYFIDNAFPEERICNEVLANANGRSFYEICAAINDRSKAINHAISFLEFDGYLRKEGWKYYRVPKPFVYDRVHYDDLTKMRRHEMQQMKTLIETDECLLRYVIDCLDAPAGPNCGRCANCLGEPLLWEVYSTESRDKALEFIERLIITIEPRRQWAVTNMTKQSNIPHPLQPGLCLSNYGDVGYGDMVKYDKYKANAYRDELLVKSINALKEIVGNHHVRFLTYVPSLRCDKVKRFAEKLARALGLKFIDIIHKRDAPQQKEMENSSHQCQNALHSFSIPQDIHLSGNIILVDDIVDSRWTLTVCGNLLGECGFEFVIPFCLADSSGGETDGGS